MVQPSENEWSLSCFNQELFSNIKLNEKANRHLSATAGYHLNKVRKHSNTKYHLEMHTCQTSIKIAVGIFSTKFIVITSGERDREGSERIQGSLWLYLQDFLKKVMEKQESHLGVHTASFYKEGNLATSIKVTWRRHWWPTPVLLPGDAHGQRSLIGCMQSMGSQRVDRNWATSLSLFTFMHWRRKWQPTPVFLPGESQGRGAWWTAIYGVTQSRTRLKRLSSSSSIKVTNAHILGHNSAYLEIFVQIYAHAYKIRYIQDFTSKYFFSFNEPS